ncbi:MAG: DUF898 family protein [Kiloniellales bacterium]
MGQIGGIALLNGLLGVLTLGVYRFWGKTRLRRYLWSRVNFDGDRMEYTGRPLELLLGFLIAIFILTLLGIVFAAVEFVFPDNEVVLGISGVIQGLGFAFLIQIAIYRARRYRLTRTQWRGIRGGQSGSAIRYALLAFGWYFVAFLTLGLAYPVTRTRLQRYRTKNTWMGDRGFAFEGRAGDLFARWFIAWLLLIPTLGMSLFWYQANEFRYFAGKTRYGALQFHSQLRTGRVIWIGMRYLLIVLLLFGVLFAATAMMVPGLMGAVEAMNAGDEAVIEAMGPSVVLVPFAMLILFSVVSGVLQAALYLHPMLAEICWTLRIAGDEDFAAIAQSRQYSPSRGEGLADALDVGAI